jgi:hypothetical protein
MIEHIRQRIGRGEDVPDCLAKTLLLIQSDEELDDLDMAMIASAFMIGGVETVRHPLFYNQALQLKWQLTH